jgi:hypothetical protein
MNLDPDAHAYMANNGFNLGIGISAGISAKLHIKGTGITSGTAGLLVQNNSGHNSFTVDDAGVTTVKGASNSFGTLNLQVTNLASDDLINVDDSGRMSFGGAPYAFVSGTSYLTVRNSYTAAVGDACFSVLGKTNLPNLTVANSCTGVNINANAAVGMQVSCDAAQTIIFRVMDSAIADKFVVYPDGKITVGSFAPTAQLGVRGSGTTSGTTALLVQNISGTDLLRTKDDGTISAANLSTYASDFAAGVGGLVANDIYKTSTGELRIKL